MRVGLAAVGWRDSSRLVQRLDGQFYAVVPHDVLVGVFGAVGLAVLLAQRGASLHLGFVLALRALPCGTSCTKFSAPWRF